MRQFSKQEIRQIISSSTETELLIVANVLKELHEAQKKHATTKDIIHRAAIVAEEAGELIRSTLQYRYEDGNFYSMHQEAIQTAAMGIRFVLDTNTPSDAIAS